MIALKMPLLWTEHDMNSRRPGVVFVGQIAVVLNRYAYESVTVCRLS